MEYGKKMIEFRAKYNLSQSKLAKIFGVTITTIHRLENNKNKPSAMHKSKFDKIMKEWEEKKND